MNWRRRGGNDVEEEELGRSVAIAIPSASRQPFPPLSPHNTDRVEADLELTWFLAPKS